ncbi:MAG: lactate utilization protein [Thermodesulfobacteriota bacterium]
MEGNKRQVNMELGSRDKVLRRIKSALHGSSSDSRSGSEPVSHKLGRLVKDKIPIKSDNNLEREDRDLIDIFTNELGKVNGLSKVLSNEAEVREYISNVTTEHDSKSFIVWETALINQLKVIEYLKSNGLRAIKSHDKMHLERADIGITEADYAIADSATLVLFSNPRKARLVSLITPIHIAILDSKKIVRNIFDLFQVLTQEYDEELHSKDIMSCITFITGPSRTADIELNLTLGVHGPKEVHVLIYNNIDGRL